MKLNRIMRWNKFLLLGFLAFTMLACNSNTEIESTVEGEDPQKIMNDWMTANFKSVAATKASADPEASEYVLSFYEAIEQQRVWTSGDSPNEQSQEVFSLMENARNFGLDTMFYDLEGLRALQKTIKETDGEAKYEAIAQFEYKMTQQSVLFMSHLNQGLLDPDSLWFESKLDKMNKDAVSLLKTGAEENDLVNAVLSAQPDFYEYHALQQGLAHFLENYDLNQETAYISNPKKDSAKVVVQANEALVALGFLPDSLVEDDEAAMAALKEFQSFCGLEPDGKVGKNTRRALMVSNQTRYEQAVVSLQRLRWEADTVDRYIYVNIPEYKAKVIENNAAVREFRVVVGAPWTPTPTLTSSMKHFVTNPQWYVPYSISKGEIMPKAKNDSTYLARNGYRVYQGSKLVGTKNIDWSQVKAGAYKIRQVSGRGNALGKVKFIFKNEHSVYMHDTNQKRFFKKDVRAYSHGCMRLENPFEMADYLVQYEQHVVTPDSLDSVFAGGRRMTVNLAQPIEVKVRYVTCVGNPDGTITFFTDIYKKDEEMCDAFFSSSASGTRKMRRDEKSL